MEVLSYSLLVFICIICALVKHENIIPLLCLLGIYVLSSFIPRADETFFLCLVFTESILLYAYWKFIQGDGAIWVILTQFVLVMVNLHIYTHWSVEDIVYDYWEYINYSIIFIQCILLAFTGSITRGIRLCGRGFQHY